MAKMVVVEGAKEQLKWCEELEAGNILLFPKAPFEFPKDEIEFLLTQRQGTSGGRKNIAYKPQIDRITNHDAKDSLSAEKLKVILRGYSRRATEYLKGLLAPYEKDWKLDYASFRPFQEKGRKLRVRARNDLLHVDAFPTRPLHGARILRFFTNINPTESRRWVTSDDFRELVRVYGGGVPIPSSGGFLSGMKFLLSKIGLKIPLRSPYDTFMLNFHNFLKENGEFQEKCRKDYWDFPPGCCWAVFTDQVSHAALAGQYALEQTFLIPQRALLHPSLSPLAVLERGSGKNLVDPKFSAVFFG